MTAPRLARLDDPAWLRAEYVDRDRTQREIAAELHCPLTTVHRVLARHGISNGRLGSRVHGYRPRGARTPTYVSWAAMVDRCTNPGATGYPRYYGGRSAEDGGPVTICAGLRTFVGFLAMCGERPAGRSLDRIDGAGSYTCGRCPQCARERWPANVRWATPKEQAANRRPPRKRKRATA
jgi:hypothetical protein